MKKVLLGLLLSIVLLIGAVLPIHADQPTYETWVLGGMDNGLVKITYLVNTTSLFVESFTIVNDTTYETIEMYIYQHDSWDIQDRIFYMTCGPMQTVTQTIDGFKWHHVAGEPPESGILDPPPGTIMGFRN